MEDSRAGEVMCISCEDKTYALEFEYVAEICIGIAISKIPSLPDCFVGVCNNRGEIIPVISMYDGIDESDKDNILLIIKNRNYKFAILLNEEPYIVSCEGLGRVKNHIDEIEGGVWIEKEIWKSDTNIISLVDVERTIERLILYP